MNVLCISLNLMNLLNPMNSEQLSALLKMCYHSDYKVDEGPLSYYVYHVEYDRDTDTHKFLLCYSNGIQVNLDSRTPIPPSDKPTLRYMYDYYLSK
jgi:hypothetical protein